MLLLTPSRIVPTTSNGLRIGSPPAYVGERQCNDVAEGLYGRSGNSASTSTTSKPLTRRKPGRVADLLNEEQRESSNGRSELSSGLHLMTARV